MGAFASFHRVDQVRTTERQSPFGARSHTDRPPSPAAAAAAERKKDRQRDRLFPSHSPLICCKSCNTHTRTNVSTTLLHHEDGFGDYHWEEEEDPVDPRGGRGVAAELGPGRREARRRLRRGLLRGLLRGGHHPRGAGRAADGIDQHRRGSGGRGSSGGSGRGDRLGHLPKPRRGPPGIRFDVLVVVVREAAWGGVLERVPLSPKNETNSSWHRISSCKTPTFS